MSARSQSFPLCNYFFLIIYMPVVGKFAASEINRQHFRRRDKTIIARFFADTSSSWYSFWGILRFSDCIRFTVCTLNLCQSVNTSYLNLHLFVRLALVSLNALFFALQQISANVRVVQVDKHEICKSFVVTLRVYVQYFYMWICII